MSSVVVVQDKNKNIIGVFSSLEAAKEYSNVHENFHILYKVDFLLKPKAEYWLFVNDGIATLKSDTPFTVSQARTYLYRKYREMLLLSSLNANINYDVTNLCILVENKKIYDFRKLSDSDVKE